MKDERTYLNKLVNNLIYPGILGSMIYDFLLFDFSLAFVSKIFIVFFFLADYWHLEFFMREEFSLKEQNKKTYFIPDLMVSFFLVTAFQLVETNQAISLFLLATIPILFLQYADQLKYELFFYRTFAFFSVAFLYTVLFFVDKNVENEYILPIFTFVQLVTYSTFVISQWPNKTLKH